MLCLALKQSLVYEHPLACSKEEAHRCWTIDNRMKVTKKEPDFEDMLK